MRLEDWLEELLVSSVNSNFFEENDFFLDEDVFLEEEDFFSTLLEDFSEESFGFAVWFPEHATKVKTERRVIPLATNFFMVNSYS